MKNILEMTLKEKTEFINSFDDVMADCDGMYLGQLYF